MSRGQEQYVFVEIEFVVLTIKILTVQPLSSFMNLKLKYF